MYRRHLMTAFAALCLVLAGGLMFDALPPAQALAAGPAHPFGDHGGLLSVFALGGFTLAELRQKRSKLLEELEALAKGELTDETRSAFDAKDAELQKLDEDIKRAERLDATRRAAAAAAQTSGDEQRSAGEVPDQRAPGPARATEPRDLGIEFGAFVRAYAMSAYSIRSGAGQIVTPAQAAVALYGERHPVTENVTRAQTMSDNDAGGFRVTPTYASEIIRLFGPMTIVRRRAQVVPGNADYLKGKTGASVGYVGENEQGQVTGVTFGMLSMREKDISAILPISKKLLRNTAFGVEAYCRDELVRAAAEFEDRMFLYGSGTGKQVKGYAFSIPAARKITATNSTTPTNAQVRGDCRKVLKAISEADVPLSANQPAWFMHPTVLLYLQDLYQGDVPAFPTLQGDNPTLYGHPVDTSTQVAGPAGAGGDIFFGAHRYAMIGDSVTMSLSVSDQASFKDASGQQVNMWAQGLMAIKLDMSHDFALRYEQAFAQLADVKWGA